MPRISLLVTCYNAADYIAECVESVKGQTFTDWECLIGDDCSTDGTREAILAAIGTDTRFKVRVHQMNKGGGENLRFLMEEATGDIMVELGGDDFLLPDALARIDQEYHEHPDCEVTSGSFVVTPRGGVLNHKPDLLWWQRWCHCKPLTWKREVGLRALAELREVIFDPETGGVPRYGWDVAIYLPIRYLARGYRTIHDVLYAYREHPSNDAKGHRADQIATEKRVCGWLDERLMPADLPWLVKK